MTTIEPTTSHPVPEETAPAVTEPTPEHTTEHVTEHVTDPVVTESSQAEPVESATPVVSATETPVVVQEESAPKPVLSKSNTTKRLSLFLKSFVGDKKASGPKSPVEETRAIVPQEAPVAEETEPESEHKIKSEKRKSILGGLFRSKSPVKELEHNESTTPSVPPKDQAPAETTEVAEESTAPAEHTTAPTAAVATTAAAATAAAAAHHKEEHETEEPRKEHKDNVIDQIKRSSIGKFFNKKKEVTKEESEDAAHVANATEQDEAKTSRPSSPLGRSLTHLFRGKSTKKKTEDENVDPVLDNPISPTPINTVKVN